MNKATKQQCKWHARRIRMEAKDYLEMQLINDPDRAALYRKDGRCLRAIATALRVGDFKEAREQMLSLPRFVVPVMPYEVRGFIEQHFILEK